MNPTFAVLAAGEAPAFFTEVALLLVAGAVVAYVCNRIRVMPIVSFLVTGALIGPHALGLVRDEALIEAAAEVGVVLLLFTIGIEFSLAKLARIKRLIFVGGGLQVGLVVAVVTGLLALAGVDWRTGVFTGCLVALSSTAIVMKLLMDRGQTNSESGQAALGILIFQDLAIVAMVLLVPALAGGAEGGGGAIALALGKAVAIVVLVILVARRLMPKVLEAVARTCSQEIFLLTVVAICFGTAWLTSLAGVSLSLGAFLAGLMVSESRFSEMAFGEILPLQILFSATFFISVGLLLDLGFLVANPLVVLAIIAGALVLKALATGLSLRLLGYGTGTMAATGLMLAQVGEFSFVLERTGRDVGLYPAGLAEGGPQAFIAATVVMMIATPFLASLGERLKARKTRPPGEGTAGPAGAAAAGPPEGEAAGHGAPRLTDHVIIAGYGDAGRALAGCFEAAEIPYLILTLSPEGALHAEAAERHVLRGNYTRQHELDMAGARRARLLIVADDDLETTRRVVAAARATRPDLRILVRTRYASEIEELHEAGAAEVVTEERESVARLLAEVLGAYGVDPDMVASYERAVRAGDAAVDASEEPGAAATEDADPPVRLTGRQRATEACSHVDQTRAVRPSAEGCEECLKTGDEWVHLRICMTCGKVGCCDASPNRHASEHARTAGHPIVRSFEPRETWAWCFEDETYLG